MRANNPSAAARAELRCIWPRTPKPNVVISVGTGYSETACPESERNRSILRDGFIPRTIRGFLASPSIDGESGWTDLLQNLSDAEKRGYHRISHRFAKKPPALDDASAVPGLVKTIGHQHLDCDEIVSALWASRFFMELQAEPEYNRGQYQCQAVVLFRGGDVRPLVRAMSDRHSSLRIMLGSRVLLHLEGGDSSCVGCGHFQHNFTFTIRHLDDIIKLTLAYGGRLEGLLSGSGKSVNWFIEQQTCHGRLRRWAEEGHSCGYSPKRAISVGRGSQSSKRRRL